MCSSDLILESVPPSSRRKAKLLLQMLRRHPDVSYNEQGELQYLGKAVSGSNIIDLVNDVIRHRKSSEHQGWQVFSKALKDVNVPQEYVGNRKRWMYMQRGDPSPHSSPTADSDEGEEFFETSTYMPETPPPDRKSTRLNSSH